MESAQVRFGVLGLSQRDSTLLSHAQVNALSKGIDAPPFAPSVFESLDASRLKDVS
jgi:hypothetical protein